jgi:hypothetical protein
MELPKMSIITLDDYFKPTKEVFLFSLDELNALKEDLQDEEIPEVQHYIKQKIHSTLLDINLDLDFNIEVQKKLSAELFNFHAFFMAHIEKKKNFESVPVSELIVLLESFIINSYKACDMKITISE